MLKFKLVTFFSNALTSSQHSHDSHHLHGCWLPQPHLPIDTKYYTLKNIEIKEKVDFLIGWFMS